MSLTRYANAATTVNQVALECGLPPSSAPFASADPAFIQLVGLLTAAGRELVELRPWQILHRSFSITTAPGDTGVYDLPADFGSMIDQTGWSRTTRLPVGGPDTPQQWEYLLARALGSASTLYLQFREADGKLEIYPQPPPTGQTISFRYVSRGWVKPSGWTEGGAYSDAVADPGDTILFDPYLIERSLKLKFLTAKGMDTAGAAQEFNLALESRAGKDAGGAILNLAGRRTDPLLSMTRNVPESGYGSV